MRRALRVWASAICLAVALGTAAAGQAGAQEAEFGMNPGGFVAKTHPHIPLEVDGDPSEPDTRQIDIQAIHDADPVTEAGAHPDATTHFALRTEDAQTGEPTSEPGELHPGGSPDLNNSGIYPVEDLRDVITDLPAGFMGNPEAVPACSRERFEEMTFSTDPSETCHPASQVGVAQIGAEYGSNVVNAAIPIYRVTRPDDAPAAFAFTGGGENIILTPQLRSDGDYGLRIESLDTVGWPAKPAYVTITLWGVPADPEHDPDRWLQLEGGTQGEWGTHAGIQPRPFLTNPPRCNTGDLAVDISMNSWQQSDRWLPRDLDDASEAEEYTALSPEPTDCDFLPIFEPELDMQPAENEAGSPSAYDVELTQPYNADPEGRAGAHVKRVEVELPEGTTVSPSAAHGLEACSDAEAGFGTQSVADCPPASKIGQVSVDTPLLPDPIEGAAYIGEPTEDQLLRLFIVLEGFGTVVRVAGDVDTDPETGQITAVFDDNPQVPFTDFDIRFDSGARAALVNPSDCGTHEIRTEITSWNGDTHTSRSPFTIDRGECSNEPPFDPWLSAGSLNPTATASSPFVAKFGRSDADEYLNSIDVEMPEGLVARVAGVELCDSDRADAGTCNSGSRIGHLQIASGAGSEPYWVPAPGKDATSVHLSGPYRGAPYSLSIVVPAQAGPFDLGRVVVRSPIHVDDRTTELSIDVAESRIFDRFGDLDEVIPNRMPTILEGIPLRLKETRIVIDREDFMVNPTNCRSQAISADIGAADGRSSQATSPFRATDCQALDFAPRFGMRILNPGRRSTVRSFNPAMRFAVAPRQGDANIGAAAVTLPSSIILDQSNIRTVCTRDQFAARECPQAAVYGFARAWSPLLERPIQGPVYLGSSDNQLPDLIADMRGEVRVILQGEILGTQDGRIRNVFRFVPDVPVKHFQLNMLGGANRGVLVNSRDLCRSGERGVSRFIGQNGKRQVGRHRVGLRFRGCRQVRRQAAVRQLRQRRALRKAVRTGNLTPAQARRTIRS